jgi:ketosteroid isomerase-like protein
MNSLERVLEFVAAINRADVTGIAGMMSEDHLFIDSDGTRIAGRQAMSDAWRGYFSMMPDYRIRVEETYCREGTVVLIGTATGTYSGGGELRPENRWSVPAAWRAVVTGDRIAVWQLFVNPEPIAQVLRRHEGAV